MKWTEESDRELAKRWENGDSFESMAEHFGRSPGAVRSHGNDIGLRRPKVSPWTKEREERLAELWAKNMSARKIAADLGNTTRLAVIGKARRLGLEEHEGVNETRVRREKKAMIVGMFIPPAKTCQFPHGNPGEKGFHFCGADPALGRPYCHEHIAVCYQTGSARPRYGVPPKTDWGPIKAESVDEPR